MFKQINFRRYSKNIIIEQKLIGQENSPFFSQLSEREKHYTSNTYCTSFWLLSQSSPQTHVDKLILLVSVGILSWLLQGFPSDPFLHYSSHVLGLWMSPACVLPCYLLKQQHVFLSHFMSLYWFTNILCTWYFLFKF